MILTGRQIQQKVQTGEIEISPFDPTHVNPNSYDLTLHNQMLTYELESNDGVLDMKKPNKAHRLEIPEHGLVLQPNRLYLGRTVEFTKTMNHVPMIEGRSSIGRLGLFVHVTAGFGDVGFAGYWTLEIFAVQPIRIYPGVRICQIFYHQIEGDFDLYKSKYQNNSDIQPSMLYKDWQ